MFNIIHCYCDRYGSGLYNEKYAVGQIWLHLQLPRNQEGLKAKAILKSLNKRNTMDSKE